MPSSIRPGDVLAGRYRLVDLLTESGGGRFWRAHDRVLDRHVALHVIAADDERAEGLLEAARRSATVHDRRLLRVLDADQRRRPLLRRQRVGLGRLPRHHARRRGPARPAGARPGWSPRSPTAIAAAHEAGVAHGRLVPENVLVDQTARSGSSGSPSTPRCTACRPAGCPTDVADLAGLLYAR